MKKTFLSLTLICVMLFSVLTPFLSFAEDEQPAFDAAMEFVRRTILDNEDVTNDEWIIADLTDFGFTEEEFMTVFNRSRNNMPEFFYLDFYYSVQSRSIYLKNRYTGDELLEKKARFTEMTEELYALHNDAWSDYETALFYHDLFAANCQYDLTYSIYDAFTFFDQRTGVCQAYTMAYMTVMHHFGIPCTYARSDAMNHIWNVVQIDGEWYHVDVTHDDPTHDRPGRAMHTQFLVCDATMEELKRSSFGVDFSDLELGMDIVIAKDDHWLYSTLKSCQAPVVAIGDAFYAIIDGSLASFDPDRKTPVIAIRKLSTMWYVPGSTNSYYPGNFSTLVTDGVYLYYFDSEDAYVYDPSADDERTLGTFSTDSAKVYGMQLLDGTMTAFTAPNPNAVSYDPAGVFTFGDVNCDEELTISDVTGLLDLLASSERLSAIDVRPADVQCDGRITISDVTALLDLLANS